MIEVRIVTRHQAIEDIFRESGPEIHKGVPIVTLPFAFGHRWRANVDMFGDGAPGVTRAAPIRPVGPPGREERAAAHFDASDPWCYRADHDCDRTSGTDGNRPGKVAVFASVS
jgi:hypothetical protein